MRMFRRVVYCSGGLYVVEDGYADFQEGYMLKNIMLKIMSTSVISSQTPERRPTATPFARANYKINGIGSLN